MKEQRKNRILTPAEAARMFVQEIKQATAHLPDGKREDAEYALAMAVTSGLWVGP